eukprot:3519746-Rhodomonas_salina.2
MKTKCALTGNECAIPGNVCARWTDSEREENAKRKGERKSRREREREQKLSPLPLPHSLPYLRAEGLKCFTTCPNILVS